MLQQRQAVFKEPKQSQSSCMGERSHHSSHFSAELVIRISEKIVPAILKEEVGPEEGETTSVLTGDWTVS